MTIIRDTVAPEIIVNNTDPNAKIFAIDGKVMISGRVEPFSKVKVNGADASVVYDIWTVVLPVTATGDLALTIEATDPAGNQAKKDATVVIWKQSILAATIDQTIININGNPDSPLPRAVKLVNGIVMVPAHLFTSLFGEAAPTPVDPATKESTFAIAGKNVTVKAGTNTITYGSDQLTVGNNVIDELGVPYLDASSFASIFGVEYEYNQATGTIVFTRLWK